MDGEAIGRVWVEAAGLIVTGFLLFLGFSGVIAGLSRRGRLRKMKQTMHHRPQGMPRIRR